MTMILRVIKFIYSNIIATNYYTQLPLILPLGYFAPHRLLILRLRRVGYPLHEPSKCKRFSNSLQIINKKIPIAKKIRSREK